MSAPEENTTAIVQSEWSTILHLNQPKSQLYLRNHFQRLFETLIDNLSKNQLKFLSRVEIEKIANNILPAVNLGYTIEII